MKTIKLLKPIALAGDVLFILWIVYNGIDEGFQAVDTIQAVVLIGLVALILLNGILLWKQK